MILSVENLQTYFFTRDGVVRAVDGVSYGVEAGAQRYFRHGANRLTPAEAARLAAILPLPKKREAVSPSGFTRRYGNAIRARIGVVGRDGLDGCVYK